MVNTILRKPLGFVLLVTAHMVFNDQNQAQFTRTLGSSITLNFTFNDTFLQSNSHVAVYTTGQKKIAERRSRSDSVLVYQNASVSYHMERLQLNGTGVYWASVFTVFGPPRESDRVQLLVQDMSGVSVPPLPTNRTRLQPGGASSFFAHITVVVALVVLAAALPLLVWCVIRAKDKQQQQQQQQEQQQHSTDTVQETVAPPSSLIYSVLDFARTPPAALDPSPSDTEYTAVSCPSEMRRVS